MINELIEKSYKQGILVEVVTKRNKYNVLTTLNDVLEKVDYTDVISYNIKALYKNKTIKLITDNIKPDVIIEMIKETADIIDNDDKNQLADSESIDNFTIDIQELDYNKISKQLLELNSLKDKYVELSSLNFIFQHSYETVKIDNMKTHLGDSNFYNSFYAEIVVNKDDKIQTGTVKFLCKEYNFEQFEEKIISCIEDTINRIDTVSCKTDKYDIVLKNRCVFKILSCFSQMFNADCINKKLSVLSDKFDCKVFSDKLTIVEDPDNEQLIGKRLFDDEGVLTSYKEIIKDGKFVCKLYDNESALKDNTKSTGNSYGVRNMYIIPGDNSFDSLTKELNNGIIITELQGLHAGVDLINGQISLQAEGYYVENGERKQSLNMIILSTNLFELFNNIDIVGNDLEFFGKMGGAPSLLIKNITIAGKE